MKVDDFEKLGVFYLGRRFDPIAGKESDELVLYDSSDLVTHAVCIGMTGSGKTGLCLDLIEEAAIDGVPVIAIDPKGDIANLLLSFPDLSAEEFQPWVSEDEARRRQVSTLDLAKEQAQIWREGLAQWGQDGERIRKMRTAADFVIYTPGSTAGLPVSILQNLSAPTAQEREDSDLLAQRVAATVMSLLALLGINADPLKSKEHILLSNILDRAWLKGQDMDLAALIQQIQKPPITQVGALDLESFFPASQRFEFAMSINNLIAAPGFEAWLKGEPMNVDAFLYTQSGKPKVSIFSIAHLSDSERMFFVSLLLNRVVSWMRGQSGTTSLRAIVYMDEIFGYFPPIANPPSKMPLLTLLKQARAYGVGVVLATQNPVDLDYKGLANTGTWFVGRLQTERDKMRLLDGLEGVAAECGAQFDRRTMEQILSSLKRRVFLINNVHSTGPDVFETRFSLSYLRGPLTRNQIKTLMAPLKAARDSNDSAPLAARVESGWAGHISSVVGGGTQSPSAQGGALKPALSPDIPQYYMPSSVSLAAVVYQPMLLGIASIRYVDSKARLDLTEEKSFLIPFDDGPLPVQWDNGSALRLCKDDLLAEGLPAASYMVPPPAAMQAKSYKSWSKDFAAWLGETRRFYLLKSPSTGEFSLPSESERDFRLRLNQRAVEKRDAAVQQLRAKYAPFLSSLEQKILTAQQRVAREAEEAKEKEMQAAISIGATILGAFVGRKAISTGSLGRATTAARSASKVGRQRQEVARAEESLDSLNQQLNDLQKEFQIEWQSLNLRFQAASEALDTVTFAAKKSNINVQLLCLVWVPKG
jgi:hypothetical protein